jgi:hypothetical protein
MGRGWWYTDDIRIEDEEGIIVLSKDVSGQGKRARSAKGLRLHRECNSDIVLFFILSWMSCAHVNRYPPFSER